MVRELNGLLSPYVTRNENADAIIVLQARVKWPQAQLDQILAEEKKITTQRELERVRQSAQQRVAQARIPARKPLMRELFAQLEVCAALAEKVKAYDDQTQQLCGSRPETPAPELLTSWSSDGESAVAYRKRHFREWVE